MALQITETRGMFSVHGELNSSNANILNRHMSRFISPNNHIILNLERVTNMDKCAAYALRKLYLKTMQSNSILSIIGLQNQNILSVMDETKTTYILSDDRI
ncbi:STAS domain-containing protein [Croceitalea marina]|uniref:STAS domain-containing protein n=1 Tax=Croceitalea marina TaxID=1775166 RepID=A0ABW5MYW9_9FLAO